MKLLYHLKLLLLLKKAKKENRSCWRISSTLFSHISSDEVIEPLYKYKTEESFKKYPPILAGDQVYKELQLINLAK